MISIIFEKNCETARDYFVFVMWGYSALVKDINLQLLDKPKARLLIYNLFLLCPTPSPAFALSLSLSLTMPYIFSQQLTFTIPPIPLSLIQFAFISFKQHRK